jgi:hypothetical protein
MAAATDKRKGVSCVISSRVGSEVCTLLIMYNWLRYANTSVATKDLWCILAATICRAGYPLSVPIF